MIQFAARPEFVRKLEEARALLSGRFPKGTPFAVMFETALDLLLERHNPWRRNARRKERNARQKERETRRVEEGTSRLQRESAGEEGARGERERGVNRGA